MLCPCGHPRTQLRDIHHPYTWQGRVEGHLISALLCLATEFTPATAAHSSLTRTSQGALSACKEDGNILYMPERRREQDIDELVMSTTCPKCRVNTVML